MPRKKEWFDDESFWRDFYPFMFSDTRLAASVDEVGHVLRLTKPKGKRVLDLCCGPGRCAVVLAKRGFTVTGVDRTRFLLSKARAGAKAAKVKVEWILQDMRDFVRPDSFDLVLSMFTSFGYFNDKGQDMAVLRNIFASLKAGGSCFIDIMGKESLSRLFQPTISRNLPNGTILVQRHRVFDDWTRMGNEWILIKKGKAKIYRFHITIYSGQELKNRLEQAGFTDVKLYGNLRGDDYGYDAIRLVAVAKKPR